MLLQRPQDVVFEKLFSMLIYGEPGIGKSTTALSSQKPVLIDCENGMKRVDPKFWCPRVLVNSIDEVYELLNDKETLNEFETIVIDPLSALIDLLIEDVAKRQPNLKKGNNLTIQGFGALKAAFNTLWRTIKTKGKNIILVAHERAEKLGEVSYMTPDTGAGSSGRELIKDLDIIGRISHLNGKRAIFFDTDNSEFFCKNPFEFPRHIVLPTPKESNAFIVDTIVPAISDHFEKMRLARLNFQKLEEDIAGLLDSIVDEESCNTAYKALKTDHDVRGYMWKKKLSEIIKPLNLAFNKSIGAFEHVENNA